MAAITQAATATWNNTTGNATLTATPALNDLIVVIAGATGGAATAITDNNSDGLGTYSKIGMDRIALGGDALNVWVRNALIGSATSTVFTDTKTGDSGGGLDVYRVSGMTRVGPAAVRSRGGAGVVAAASTPAPVLGLAPLTGNPIITAVQNSSNPGGVTGPTSYTRSTNVGQTGASTGGLDVAWINSGITSATITWGGTSATQYAQVAIELDTSSGPAATAGNPANGGANSGDIEQRSNVTSQVATPWFATTASNTMVIGVRAGGAGGTITCDVSENSGGSYSAATIADAQHAVTSAGILALFTFTLAGAAAGNVRIRVNLTVASTIRFSFCEYVGTFTYDAATSSLAGSSVSPDSGALVTTLTRTLIGFILTGRNASPTDPLIPGTTNSLTWRIRDEMDSLSGGNASCMNCALLDFDGGGQAAGTYHALGTITNSDNWGAEIYSFSVVAAAGSIPWNPQRYALPTVTTLVPWTQKDLRDANRVATAANPTTPVLSGIDGPQYFIPAYADRRFVPQQRPYISNPSLLATAELENELLGGAGTALRYNAPAEIVDRRQTPPPRLNFAVIDPTTNADPTLSGPGAVFRQLPAEIVDRRLAPQQRPYISDPSFYPAGGTPTDPTQSGIGWVPFTAALQVDRRRYQAPAAIPASIDDATITVGTGAVAGWWSEDYHVNFLVSSLKRQFDTALLNSSLLENELLGGAGTAMRYNQPATHVDRRSYPLERLFVSDPAMLLTALLENELLGGAETAKRANTAPYYDRRLVPQQRAYVSDPNLLGTALLENELLGGAGSALRYGLPAYWDRRLVPQQRPYGYDPALTAPSTTVDPTLTGLDLYQFGAAFNVDRRSVPQQRAYVSDPSFYSAGVIYDPTVSGINMVRLQGTGYTDRRLVPQQRAYISDPGFYGIQADPTLLGLDLHPMTYAFQVPRVWSPRQRLYVSDPSMLLTALLENELLGGAGTAMRYNTAPYYDRRQVPQQRLYGYDPNLLAPSGVDPLTVAYGAGGLYWQLYNQAGWQPDRRAVPQQRAYISDPSFLPPLAPDTLLLVRAWATGGPLWQTYNTAANVVDRREVPFQIHFFLAAASFAAQFDLAFRFDLVDSRWRFDLRDSRWRFGS